MTEKKMMSFVVLSISEEVVGKFIEASQKFIITVKYSVSQNYRRT
jgi:hypothetical protein